MPTAGRSWRAIDSANVEASGQQPKQTTPEGPDIMSRIPQLASTLALAVSMAAGLILGGPTPAHAVGFTTSAILVDADTVVISDPASPARFSGTGTTKFDRNFVRVIVSGIFQRATATPGCRATRVIFTYADGSTTEVTSPRLCKEFNTVRVDPVFWSHDDRSVVKYAVQMLSSADSTAPLTVIAGNTEFVGDAPDSLGTATRLDHDTHQLVITASGRTATMFQGSTDFYLQRHDVSSAGFTWWTTRARVTGTLNWSDLITGSEAYVSVTWYYSDGSQSSVLSDKVVRGVTPTKSVNLTSSSTKYVVSVKMAVYSNQAGLGSVSSAAEAKFGDGSGAA
jgi:hypothetical protein